MATHNGRESHPLIREFLSDCQSYHFFQAIHLLENIYGEEQLWSYVLLVPSSKLSFPASDIQDATINDDGVITIYLNFLGLQGVDSPLPLYLLQMANQQTEQANYWRDYLDIFNPSIYQSLYSAWKKMHPLSSRHEYAKYHSYIQSLAGFNLTADMTSELAYASLYGMRIRSAIGLQYILSDYLLAPVAIKQFVLQWLTIEGNVLGELLCLGDNTVVGDHVLDDSSTITIYIECLEESQYISLLLDDDMKKQINNLINNYIPPLLQYEVKVRFSYNHRQILKLGFEEIILGCKSWLGGIYNN